MATPNFDEWIKSPPRKKPVGNGKRKARLLLRLDAKKSEIIIYSPYISILFKESSSS